MKAAVYYSNSDVRIEDVPRPAAGPGELVVKVMASGICGSDVMEWYRIRKAPVILGHEIAGVVEEVGEGVERFKVGEAVTAAHHVPCNTCRYCLAGGHSVCELLRTTNFDPGGFCEYVRVPAVNVDRGVFRLPRGMSFIEGSFSEPLGCVVRGLRVARFEPGRSVLVLGSGISGILHIKLVRALGAGPVVATDVNAFRLEAARRAGADLAVAADADVAGAVREATAGRLADFVVLCTAHDSAIAQAVECVERGGTIIFFAPKGPGETYPMPLFELWRDNVKLVNTYASPPGDTLTALDLMASGRVEVEDMVTHRLPLDDAARGFALTARAGESMKVVIEPHRPGG
ncbi:MAG TPA: alcohol dehydrogenase [Deltaproteobacteria bacterium]|nr:alcohol dehydrogenase [Deltaproteobacteria bacterium]